MPLQESSRFPQTAQQCHKKVQTRASKKASEGKGVTAEKTLPIAAAAVSLSGRYVGRRQLPRSAPQGPVLERLLVSMTQALQKQVALCKY